jgi:AcrR family transcriptional regulator
MHHACFIYAQRVSPPPLYDETLLSGAQRAFARYGYNDATLQRIAEEAGLSRVTLHRRGITREGLLDALAQRAVEDYRQRMWPVLTADRPAIDRLAAALRVLCQSTEAHLATLTALGNQGDRVFHQDAGDQPRMTRDSFTEPLEHLLREGTRDHSVRDLDVTQTATLIFNQVGWTYLHLRTGHQWPSELAQASVVDMALNGLRRD